MTSSYPDHADAAVVAVQTRGDLVENVHHGSIAVVTHDGELMGSVGDPHAPVYPRSALKPLQLVAMLRLGLELADDELLALAASSHSGSPAHIAAVQRLLRSAGLEVDQLQNTPDLPYGEPERTAWLRAGRPPASVVQPCSGKHAAMLATSKMNGWPLRDYLAFGHPLQVAIKETIEELAGAPVAATGVDGCRAPTFAVPLRAIARAYGLIAAADDGCLEGRVAAAMRAKPEVVAGEGRDVTQAMRVLPGAIVKDGAAGVQLIGLQNGTGIAIKIADGTDAVRMPVAAHVLGKLGIPGADALNDTLPVQREPDGRAVAAITAVDAWPARSLTAS